MNIFSFSKIVHFFRVWNLNIVRALATAMSEPLVDNSILNQ